MMKQGGMLLSGRTILGLCLVVIGLLIFAYGGAEFGLGLSLGFQSFLIGALICILVGSLLPQWAFPQRAFLQQPAPLFPRHKLELLLPHLLQIRGSKYQ